MPKTNQPKPSKPYPDFPLFAHKNGQWAKKIKEGDKWKFAYFGPWNDPEGALQRFNEAERKNLQDDSTIVNRPKKPYEDFPLYAHSSGKWAITLTIGGKRKTYYFGNWDNPEGALQEYLLAKDDLLTGRPILKTGGVIVRDLCNRFLASKEKRINSGELSQRTWDDYYDVCEIIIEVFGKNARVAGLRPVDFEKLRDSLWNGERTKRSPITVANYIGRIRVVFNFAEHEELIPGRVRYGKSFQKPNAKTLRKAKLLNGKKMFEAGEIKQMLEIARPQIKAMILLGVNFGFGNTDCVNLYPSSIQGDWVRLPRSKTAIQRHCPLWPETLDALKAFKWGEIHVFTTKYGNTWGPKTKHDNPIANEMRKLMKKVGVYQKDRGFYALRHTFNTIGLRTKDETAVKYIMGHVADGNDMTANYNQEPPPDEDLIAVTKYVRRWLFG